MLGNILQYNIYSRIQFKLAPFQCRTDPWILIWDIHVDLGYTCWFGIYDNYDGDHTRRTGRSSFFCSKPAVKVHTLRSCFELSFEKAVPANPKRSSKIKLMWNYCSVSAVVLFKYFRTSGWSRGPCSTTHLRCSIDVVNASHMGCLTSTVSCHGISLDTEGVHLLPAVHNPLVIVLMLLLHAMLHCIP